MDECDTAAAVLNCGLVEDKKITKAVMTAVQFNNQV